MKFSKGPLTAFDPDGKAWFHPVWVAEKFGTRLKGLMFTDPEPLGVWFPGCSSVHSHWMRYPLDVLFLAEDGTVLRHQVLKPWSATSHPQAASFLEIPCGVADIASLPNRLVLAETPFPPAGWQTAQSR
jgi:uncharacterized membrane protein (UPF0127 family)